MHSEPAPADFRREDFHYELPGEAIAQHPSRERGASRLLALDGRGVAHLRFADLPGLLAPTDLLVVNDTRVVKARLAAEKDSGGRAEILLERVESECQALCQVRVSKPLKPGRRLLVAGGSADPAPLMLEVLGREGQFYRLAFPAPVLDVLEKHGQVPLPPYIARPVETRDEERYQTVWSASPGAVAAPTAGLHFTPALLEALGAAGVRIEKITLHVGAGTFQPVRASSLNEHRMHEERYRIPEATAEAVEDTARGGGRVVAVGTTVVRALEAAACAEHRVLAGPGETGLFITPGYRFRVVDALITNFHLPESTLLMLTCAFGGYRRVMEAYRSAVGGGYRFFSYGDACFIEREGSGG